MLYNIDPTSTPAWRRLIKHYKSTKENKIKDLFANEKDRFSKFSIMLDDILVDYSKNNVTDETMTLLFQLAKSCKLKDAIQAMFHGEKINVTENRAVLHTALRNKSAQPIIIDGHDPHRLTDALEALTEALGEDRQVCVAREISKKFKEFVRGSAAEVLAHMKEQPPRGEIVLVIGGALGEYRELGRSACARGIARAARCG